jgi:integrase
MKLTRPLVANLRAPKGKEIMVWDDDVPGFGVRVRDTKKSASYLFQYRIGAKQRRMNLGRCSAIDPAVARKQAAELHAKVRLGQDPAGLKAESRSRASETFGQCVETYLQWQQPQVRDTTFVDIKRHLRTNLGPLHGLHIANVDRRAIAAQLSRLATTAPVQANRTRASLSRFFNWAMGEGLADSNPALLTNKIDESGARDRALTEKEIKTLWTALPEGDFGDILKLLLLTGQREREIAELEWDEIDFERGVIELPPERTKNHRRHLIPMSDMVRDILQARSRSKDRALVFGIGEGGFSGWSKAKDRLDEAVKIPPWRIHDLRRSCATHMGELGVQPHIIEACLNHVSGHRSGVAGIYNRAAYEAEKARALTMWADHVGDVVEDTKSKVVALRRPRP